MEQPYRAPPLLEITLRGQWSDCYSLQVFANYTTGTHSATREFDQEDFLSKLIEKKASIGSND
jgi:hypothetical protein